MINKDAKKVYEAQNLEGPALHFTRLDGANFGELLKNTEFTESREVIDNVVGLFNEKDRKTVTIQEVIGILKVLATENKWYDYDDISYTVIREELESKDYNLRARKTSKDIEGAEFRR